MKKILSHLSVVFCLLLLFVVSACGAGSGSDASNPNPSLSLNAPSNLHTSSADSQITLTWSPVSGASSYNVYVAQQSGINKQNYSTLPHAERRVGVSSPFIHTGLTNDQNYYYVITALNSSGESIESAEIVATPHKAILQLAAGSQHTCILLADHTVKCWGNNENGRLGNDDTRRRMSTPTPVSHINTATAISVGENSSCALLADKTVMCWGSNLAGQLGNNNSTLASSSVPVAVMNLMNVKAIVSGWGTNCALLEDKTVWCWGSYETGRGVYDYYLIPHQVAGLNDVKAISVGYDFMCGVLENGHVKCRGANDTAQLANATTITFSNDAVEIPSITNAVAMSSGMMHSCALLSDSTVKCWGNNTYGQLGLGARAAASDVSALTLSSLSHVSKIYSGYDHSCALLEDKTLKCWGQNNTYQLGNGYNENSVLPVSVVGLSNINQVALGEVHSCALTEDQDIKCWGSNRDFQLGVTGSIINPVTGINNAISIVAGHFHTCSLLEDKTVKCWGENSHGELGNNELNDSSVPVAVNGLDHISSIATRVSHTCAVYGEGENAGKAKCWGWNGGQMGVAANAIRVSTASDADLAPVKDPVFLTVDSPVSTPFVDNIASMSLGIAHSCVIKNDSTVSCLGWNNYNQLGFESAMGFSGPYMHLTDLRFSSTVRQLVSGYMHNCALLTDGTVQCWGEAESNQLGDTLMENSSASPIAVVGVNNVSSIASGDDFTCALLNNHHIKCWGDNRYGQSGASMSNTHILATEVTGINNAIAVAAGANHACALLDNHHVKCWGDDSSNQLGVEGESSYTPIEVSNLSNVTALALGSRHSCALLNDKSISCWGDDSHLQLGGGEGVSSVNFYPSPLSVLGL